MTNDVEVLWDVGIDEQNTFHRMLNKLDPNLKFTLLCGLDLQMYESDKGLCVQK